MAYGIRIKVWGDYACFTRPEMKVERVSYDVMTPSAARGIVEAIYFKPEIMWLIDKITVLKEIKYANIRRNEVKSKLSPRNVAALEKGSTDDLSIIASADRYQRAATVLKDVEYIIEAHFVLTGDCDPDEEKKHHNIIMRRLASGQCFKQPCLGNREFPAFFEQFEKGAVSELKGEQDLGYMLYDLKFRKTEQQKNQKKVASYLNDAEPIFYRPKMVDGVIDVAKYRAELWS